MNNKFDGLIDTGLNGIITMNKLKEELFKIEIDDSIKSCALRLIQSWKLYNDNEQYKVDFELALRDYLLLVKKPIFIPSYVISDLGSKIGLFLNDNMVWCRQIYPTYFNYKFANRCSEYQTIYQMTYPKCFLNTSNLIRKATNFKTYKSEEQKLCVSGALNYPEGYTVLVSMSTGGGKSLITQSLACQYEQGLTIVVVPTISLMMDQFKNAKNILNLSTDEITFYHSKCNFNEFMNLLDKKNLKLLFISPETIIKNNSLKKKLFQFSKEKYIKNIVIDEAHIIFEWGDSFRLDFQCLDVFTRKLRELDKNIRVFLLSATFKQQDVRYLKKMFCMENKWLEFRCDSLRKEIQYSFIRADNLYDKNLKMIELVTSLPHPMIIYVSCPEEAEKVQNTLLRYGIHNTYIFTGLTANDDRNKIIDKWKNDEFSIMIATCAFGVGVDKKDVRTVLHLYIPDNASKYYQEAGRGGRDGKASLSVLLYIDEDFETSFNFVKKRVLTTQKIYDRWFSMIESSKSIKYGNGTARLDTSIVPSYFDDDNYNTKSNSKHVDWNVYVLMFLKRHNLIDVIDLDYKEEKYYLTVKINDNTLFCKNDYIFEKIESLRSSEWNQSEISFLDIKKAIINSNNSCISDLFLKTYTLISLEYCAGCNSHSNVIYSRFDNHLPLVSTAPYIGGDSIKINENYSALIIKNDNINIVEKKLCDNGVSTFVQMNEKIIGSNNDCKIFSYFEFYKLLDGNTFFFSKNIAFECPSNENEILSLMVELNRLIDEGIKPIIITVENYYIDSKGKYLNELIESTYKEFYMMEKELK